MMKRKAKISKRSCKEVEVTVFSIVERGWGVQGGKKNEMNGVAGYDTTTVVRQED